jgi:hypothetical protein
VTVAKDTQPPGQGWLQIIHEESLEAFAGHFAEDVSLDASVLDEQVKGPSGIRRVFSATARAPAKIMERVFHGNLMETRWKTVTE